MKLRRRIRRLLDAVADLIDTIRWAAREHKRRWQYSPYDD